jgi:hypothetical protein
MCQRLLRSVPYYYSVCSCFISSATITSLTTPLSVNKEYYVDWMSFTLAALTYSHQSRNVSAWTLQQRESSSHAIAKWFHVSRFDIFWTVIALINAAIPFFFIGSSIAKISSLQLGFRVVYYISSTYVNLLYCSVGTFMTVRLLFLICFTTVLFFTASACSDALQQKLCFAKLHEMIQFSRKVWLSAQCWSACRDDHIFQAVC